jgi:tetratricopeptide (TPR) repeat protein
LNRGIAHSQQGNHQQALSDYTQAIKLDEEMAGAYANRGVTRAVIGNPESAIADLEKAAKLYQEQGNQQRYQIVQQRLEQLQE